MIQISVEHLKQILGEGGYVNITDLSKIRETSSFYSYVEQLLSNELINKNLLGQALAEFYKVDYLDLSMVQPEREQVLRLPEDFAKKYNVILIEDNDKSVTLTTDNPEQAELMAELKKGFTNKEIKLAFSLTEDIEELFIYYLKPLETRSDQGAGDFRAP